MKRFIIFLALLTFTFCSYDECNNKWGDTDSCKSIEIEDYDGFSCFKSSSKCLPFPKDADLQKAYANLVTGFWLETNSILAMASNVQTISSFNKETYTENDIIVSEQIPLTDEQKNVLKSNNTCTYIFINGFNRNENKFNNVEDKNICYSATKYSKLDGLMDCGYIDFKFKALSNKDVSIKTCFLTPNENMPEELKKYFKKQLNIYITRLLDIKKILANDAEDPSYNIVVENSNGNKVLYTDESDVPIRYKDSGNYEEKATKIVNSFWDTLYEVGIQLSSFIGSITKKIINI